MDQNPETALAYINAGKAENRRVELQDILKIYLKLDQNPSRSDLSKMSELEEAICEVNPKYLYYRNRCIKDTIDNIMSIAEAGSFEGTILHVTMRFYNVIGPRPENMFNIYAREWSESYLKITPGSDLIPGSSVEFTEFQSLNDMKEYIDEQRNNVKGIIDVYTIIY